eukprot:GHVT01087994.1.p2 GENE.GHVT01087994.1~~GHVT01087994.1.p2  ORF type:complete len:109 (-),score=18.79 GHVT01087994.1:2526-2852(-)
MPPKEKKTKEQIAAAAMAGGKKSRKKWSKDKARDKLNHAVMFDEKKFDKLKSEIPKSKLITPSVVSERLEVNASCARQAILALEAQGVIKRVGNPHHSQMIFTRNTGA